MKGRLQVRDGIYYAVVSYKDIKGNFKQKWISTKLKERGNKKEAQKFLDNYMNTFDAEDWETYVPPTKKFDVNKRIIFMDYVEQFVDEKQSTVSASTFRGYKNLVKHMRNFFGDTDIRDVDYHMIMAFNNYLKLNKTVKNVTIKRYKEVMSPALKQAYRDDIIPKNPYDFVPPLKKEKPIQDYYDVDEIERLFEATDKTNMGLVVRVACYYGLRRSELVGLRWQSVDFNKKLITVENKVLNVKKQVIASNVLKTDASNRTFPLLPEIEALLLKRKSEIETNKQLYGKDYNMKYIDYVFVDDMGNLLLPDYITHCFRRILKENNLRHIRFHDLRHSCASLLVNKGVPMKYIQEWLGHASYNQTADTYSHLNFASKLESANVISNVLSNKPVDVQGTDVELNKNSLAQDTEYQLKQEIEKLKEIIQQQAEENQYIKYELEEERRKQKASDIDMEM
ncbi:MAG: tyrosine-type recombinase/integrase [Clostridiales bacterium]|nr:tyrosine-type recombinase/integrase [Candidatus Apopatousia equi]